MSTKKLIAETLGKVDPAPVVDSAEKHVVLSLENVSKRFCRDLKRSLYYGVQDIGRELIGQSQSGDNLRPDEFWALKNVNFELKSGDCLGIVGINGCGKTTLMRVIAGLIKPTTGRITVRGRLAPLLALGAGFNPVLTGRENIYANMSVLGLTYDEISERFEDVVKFSEIGYAIEAPVQTYSSGMQARLGFACAIATQPDILLLDEVLAVGDLNFRRKCLERLFEMRANGMSLVIVHHSPGILLAIAQKAIYMRRGEVIGQGAIEDVVKTYEKDLLEDMPRKVRAATNSNSDEDEEVSDRELKFLALELQTTDGTELVPGVDAVVVIRVRANVPLEQLNTTVTVFRKPDMDESTRKNDKQILKMISRRDGGSLVDVAPGEYEIRIALPSLGLVAGIYQIHARITRPERVVLGVRRSALFVVGVEDPMRISVYHQARTWSAATANGTSVPTRKVHNASDEADDFLEMGDETKVEV
ncbi:MAG TPA: ABC transporter ATP-binding protein [Chthoniobacterales bacterium]